MKGADRRAPVARWSGEMSDEEGNTVDDDRIASRSIDTSDAASSVIRAMLQWKWSSVTACALSILLWSLSLSSIHPYAATDTGLVSMLPVAWWLALLLALVGLTVEIQRDTPRTTPCILSLVALTLVLHGTLPATEVTPDSPPPTRLQDSAISLRRLALHFRYLMRGCRGPHSFRPREWLLVPWE